MSRLSALTTAPHLVRYTFKHFATAHALEITCTEISFHCFPATNKWQIPDTDNISSPNREGDQRGKRRVASYVAVAAGSEVVLGPPIGAVDQHNLRVTVLAGIIPG